jgi:hypothetical protein
VPERYAQPDHARGDIEAVERCLNGLGDRDRRVLVLSFYAEKTSSEIAQELGVTGTVVRVVRHRALARLRDCVRLRDGSGGQVRLRDGSGGQVRLGHDSGGEVRLGHGSGGQVRFRPGDGGPEGARTV